MIGRTVAWKPGAGGGRQVRAIRSASFCFPAVAMRVIRVVVGTIRAAVTLSGTGRGCVVQPGVLPAVATSAPNALSSACAAGDDRGRIAAPATPPAVQLEGTLMQAPTAKRQTPSATPS
jgi:hypothetical protein